MMTTELSPGLDHFWSLARRGKYPAASSGERRAYLLAKALLEHAPGLDETALEGLGEFAFIAKRQPNATEELLEG